jgi:hypothetical protein
MSDNSTAHVLRTFLDQPDALIFVGSGISCWSGLPSWEQLIEELIAFSASKGGSVLIAKEALSNKQLLEAVDALQLTPSEISEALRVRLGFSRAAPHEIHSLLVRLGPQRFVTTNYDSLLEQQLGLDNRLRLFRTITNRQVAELADIMKASADAFIYKPHGDLSDSESLDLVNDWLVVIEDCISDPDRPEGSDVSSLARGFTEHLSEKGRCQLLERINDPTDPARDFLIKNALTNIDAVTTDDLTEETGNRLVNLYLEGANFYFGALDITEQFVNDVIFPIARTLRDRAKLLRLSELLQTAGKQHDKRYAFRRSVYSAKDNHGSLI